MNEMAKALAELERGVPAALETYSNVHRGSGHNSLVSTHLYEQARDIVLEYLGLNKDKYVVIFCSPRRTELLKEQLNPKCYQSVSSQDIGLPLGIRALAVNRSTLPSGNPFQTGGGTARLVSLGWVIWGKAPDKFEASTPAIVNVIAFAMALRLIKQFGKDAFRGAAAKMLTATDIFYHDELEKYSGRELLDALRQTLIGQRVRVPTAEGVKPYINLDNAASTPTFTPIWYAVCQTWHQPRLVQYEIIHEVKSICAGALGAPLAAHDVIFTSNTTEAINLVAESLCHESEPSIESVVLNTLLEHNSNELPWRMLPSFSLIRLPVDAEGFVDLNELETLLRTYNQKGQHGKKRIKLVVVSGASNVLGIFNNLAEISRIVHRYGAHLLVDAAQLVAHRKVEMERCRIDHLAFGEENVGGIAALGKALVLLQRIGLDLIQQEKQALTERALRSLVQIPGLEIYGIKDPDSSRFVQKGGVIVFRLEGIMTTRVAKELAERGGIGVRYGCHCAHLLIKRLLNIHPLLELFQGLIVTLIPQVSLPGLTRVSLGIENSKEDIDTLIHVLGKIARRPRGRADKPFAPTNSGTPVLAKMDVQQQMDDFARAAAKRVYGLG